MVPMLDPMVSPTFKDIWDALITIPELPSGFYMERLHNKIRTLSAIKEVFNVTGFPQQNPDADWSNTNIDGVNQEAIIKDMGFYTVVSALAGIDGEKDKANFRAYVKKEVADGEARAAMDTVVSLFFAEHISNQLTKGGLPKLRDFPIGGQYAEEFRNTLMSESVIKILEFGKTLRGGTATLALLFICDYLHSGPGFRPWLGGEAFGQAPSHQVLVVWTSHLLNTPGVSLRDAFSWSTHLASAIVAPVDSEGLAVLPSAQTLKPVVQKSVMPKALSGAKVQRKLLTSKLVKEAHLPMADLGATESDLEETAVDAFESAAGMCMSIWETRVQGKWASPVALEATEQTSSQKSHSQPPKSALATPPGFSDAFMPKHVSITTTTGQEVAELLKTVSNKHPNLFTSKIPTTSHSVVKTVPAFGSCFVAGTKVVTDRGEVDIESIVEGTRVLTNAVTGAYGIASDEEVKSIPQRVMLAGFNNEGTFFTPGHVFHTTSGLRAIDPDMARSENAWINVGKLREGHTVYRLCSDHGAGKSHSYELVTIKSIQLDEGEAQHVYGIHLREGERLYHANGYLVSMNYPEITVKSVASALMQLPAAVQAKMLLNIKELAPVFSKIGLAGVSELLKRELHGFKKPRAETAETAETAQTSNSDINSLRRSDNTEKPPSAGLPVAASRRTPGYRGVNFLDMRRTYALSAQDSPHATKEAPEGYCLPVLTVKEGILLADGVAVKQAVLDVGTAHISWSRRIRWGKRKAKGKPRPYRFEHGSLDFFEQSRGMSGHGAVLLSDEASPEMLPDDRAPVIPFFAYKHVAKSSSARGQLAPVVDLGESQQTAVMRSVPISVPVFEVDDPKPPSGSGGTPAAHDKDDEEPVEDPIDNEEYWPVYVDSAEWEYAGEDEPIRASFVGTPKSIGEVGIGMWNSTKTPGASVAAPAAIFKTLDVLQARINATRPADLPAIGQLYERATWLDSDGNIVNSIRFHGASAVAALSDQARSLTDEESTDPSLRLPTRNLTFNQTIDGWKIGGPALPLLFSRCEFTISWDWSAVSGVMYELDVDNRGAAGKRFYFGSHFSSQQRSALARTKLSQQVALPGLESEDFETGIEARAAIPVIVPGMAKPAPVTRFLTSQAPLSINTLFSIAGYKDEDIHEASQTIIKKMMLWHMDNTDRQTFFATAKPTGLPSSLTTRLRSGLKTWIKGTYAHAYCAFQIASTDSATESEWRSHLSDAEKDKLRYFWAGKGLSCLSMSQEYDEIVDLATVFAIRDLYSTVLRPYTTAPEQPELWAMKLFYAIVDKDLDEGDEIDLGVDESGADNMPGFFLNQIIFSMNAVNGEGTNTLNKVCNILLALAPFTAREYGVELFNHVMAAYEASISRMSMNNIAPSLNPEEDDNPVEELQWLPDVMTKLIQEVLDPESAMTADIRSELQNNINNIMKELNEDAIGDANVIAATFTNGLQGLFTLIQGYGRLMWTGASNLRAWSKVGLADELVNVATDEAVKSGKISSTLAKVVKPLVFLATLTGAGLMIWQLTLSWKNMTATDRAFAVTSQLKSTCDLIGYSAGWNAIKKYKPPSAARNSASAVVRNRMAAYAAEINAELASATDRPYLALRKALNDMDQLLIDEGREFALNIGSEVQDVTGNRGGRDFGISLADEAVDNPPTTPDPPKRRLSKIWKNFATFSAVFEGTTLVLGLAMGIAMSFALKANWDDMDRRARVLSVIENVTMHLTTLVEAVIFVGHTLLGFQSAFFTVTLPVFGAVLAVLTLVVMIILIARGKDNADGDPPKTELEKYIDKVHAVLVPFLSPPPSRLTYTAIPEKPNSGTSTPSDGFIIRAQNTSSSNVTVNSILISLSTGDDISCMWTQENIANAIDESNDEGAISIGVQFSSPNPDAEEEKYFDIASSANMFPATDTTAINSVSTRVTGEIDDFGFTSPIVLSPQEKLEITYTNGTWQEKGFSLISIDELVDVIVDDRELTDITVTAIEIERV